MEINFGITGQPTQRLAGHRSLCTDTAVHSGRYFQLFITADKHIARFHETSQIFAKRLEHGGNANFTQTDLDFTALEGLVGPHATTEGDFSARTATTPSTEHLEGRLQG